eukprot:15037987-Alexandrium_andersonii.AAC.1
MRLKRHIWGTQLIAQTLHEHCLTRSLANSQVTGGQFQHRRITDGPPCKAQRRVRWPQKRWPSALAPARPSCRPP